MISGAACGASETRCFTSKNTIPVPVGSSFTFLADTSGTPLPKIREQGKLPKGVKFHKGAGNGHPWWYTDFHMTQVSHRDLPR